MNHRDPLSAKITITRSCRSFFPHSRPFTGQREPSEPSSFGRSLAAKRACHRALFDQLFVKNSRPYRPIRSPISSFERGLASMHSLSPSLSLSFSFPLPLFLGANLKIDARDERSSMCNERMHEAWHRGSGAWNDAMRRSLGKLTVSQTSGYERSHVSDSRLFRSFSRRILSSSDLGMILFSRLCVVSFRIEVVDFFARSKVPREDL